MNRHADRLLSPEELGEYLGLTKQQLALMRVKGSGPRFLRASAANIRYRWSDVEAWLDENTHQSTDEYTDQPGTYNAKQPA
ncbi:helix-turn-helix transcriptional regulator [Corynebacterium hadale]|uniref:helix-turn-helix transcriptional regulator n=1 Tax=Corynebacterium hadale TaxID=2026255 RepID=UPI000BAA3E19|nr:hypothetical protein [Corynebacterium hadale]PAT11278.1 hypothetical protein CKJ83_10585 [Corynebacterium hadale]